MITKKIRLVCFKVKIFTSFIYFFYLTCNEKKLFSSKPYFYINFLLKLFFLILTNTEKKKWKIIRENKRNLWETIGVTSIIASYFRKPQRTTRVIIINKWQYSRKSKKETNQIKVQKFLYAKEKKKKEIQKSETTIIPRSLFRHLWKYEKQKTKIKKMRWSNQCVKLHCLYIPRTRYFSFITCSLSLSALFYFVEK